jgi:hypothetical protein
MITDGEEFFEIADEYKTDENWELDIPPCRCIYTNIRMFTFSRKSLSKYLMNTIDFNHRHLGPGYLFSSILSIN